MKRCFVSELLPQNMRKTLANHNVSAVSLPNSLSLTTELKYHPDILCSYFVNNMYCEQSVAERINYKCIQVGGIKDGYPYDCILNNLVTDKYIITGKRVKDMIPYGGNKEIVTVNQGYVKCSTIMLSDESMITSDKSIYDTLIKLEFDTIIVSNNDIRLNGYSNGFIGGCAGVIDNAVYFTGDITKHNEYGKIKMFCDKHNTDIISLSDEALYDYGGIIEVFE